MFAILVSIVVHNGKNDNVMGNTYGYARVSSSDQNEARQLIALQNAGVPGKNIFVDRKSGKDFNRPAWRRMKRRLHEGDVLVIPSLDRLGRNYMEMLDEWRMIVRQKKADIRVLDMPLLDTTDKTRGLIGDFIAEIVLQILSFVAENERRAIRERQRQGIAAAKARGVRFGRPKRIRPENFAACAEAARSGKMSNRQAARLCGLPETTFRRMCSSVTV